MRGLLILLVCLLTLYAPIELTRVIIVWGLSGRFILEVCFMWFLYALAIFVFSAVVLRKHV